jgi:hypothetical protein
MERHIPRRNHEQPLSELDNKPGTHTSVNPVQASIGHSPGGTSVDRVIYQLTDAAVADLAREHWRKWDDIEITCEDVQDVQALLDCGSQAYPGTALDTVPKTPTDTLRLKREL